MIELDRTITAMTDRVDTSGIELDAGLVALREVLAAHVHDAWVELRRADGWVYGPVRDDDLKRHPCLVSYEALPDFEKAYDREIALATLKALLALGYAITRPERG
jgi:hypothetical protein